MASSQITDSFYVKEQDDTTEDRNYWVIQNCPCQAECSKNSWKKVKPYSFVSVNNARTIVADHLVNSSCHNKSREDAKKLSETCLVHVEVETAEDRKRYREQIEAFYQEPVVAAGSSVASSDGGGGGPETAAKRSRLRLTEAPGSGDAGGNELAAPSSGTTPKASAPVAPPALAQDIGSEHLTAFLEVIDRCREAIENTQEMFVTAGEGLNARAQACFTAAASLQSEQAALVAGREFIRDIQMRQQYENVGRE